MQNWYAEFLEQALDGIPQGEYRKRMEEELADHLQSLACALEEAGLTCEEAQKLAVEWMGDPKTLNRKFREELLRRQAKRAILSGPVYSCLISGTLYIVTALTLFRLGYQPFSSPFYHNPIAFGAVGVMLFLIPFGVAAIFMRKCFLWHPRRRTMVTLCLLVPWWVEKALLWDARQYWPWVNRPYVFLTFLGCLLLGWLSGLGVARLPNLSE